MSRNETIAIGEKESLVSSKDTQERGPSSSYPDGIEILCQNFNTESWPNQWKNWWAKCKATLEDTYSSIRHTTLSGSKPC